MSESGYELTVHPDTSIEILDPRSGELLDPKDVMRMADLVSYLREAKRSLQEGINNVQAAIVAECERQGTQSIRLEDGRTAKISGGKELVWDVEILDELLAAGLPEARFNDLVTQEVSYKVSAVLAKQIASANPVYSSIIDRARSVVEKPRYVSVGR